MRTRPQLPAGHGELLTRPDSGEWDEIARANRDRADAWEFMVGEVRIRDLRATARAEAVRTGVEYCDRLGIRHAAPGDPGSIIIATGHQPEIYHTGVWVKDFLLHSVARRMGATALDFVVDTDGFDAVEVSAPCFRPEVARCRQFLAVGSTDSAYVLSTVPSTEDLGAFCEAGAEMLASLPAPAVRRHFSSFCESMRLVAPVAGNLAELVTAARRRFEEVAGTDYIEVPVSAFGEAFAHLVASVALDAKRFTATYNAQLAEYRAITKTRSVVQPFPDLAEKDGMLELPFWYLTGGRRHALWARPLTDGGVELVVAGTVVAELPADARQAARSIVNLTDGFVAPKAVMLTLYIRLFVADLFIHGVGGGRYDRVTDGLIREYFGVEPPAFVVASLTMYLPLGAHVVTDDEIAAAREQLNRLEHNPDALLGDVDFDSEEERQRAMDLAQEKQRLVAAISAPGADKKALGSCIREVNSELGALTEPVRVVLAAQLESLVGQRADSEILTDRTYPFCLWSPLEIADKVW